MACTVGGWCFGGLSSMAGGCTITCDAENVCMHMWKVIQLWGLTVTKLACTTLLPKVLDTTHRLEAPLVELNMNQERLTIMLTTTFCLTFESQGSHGSAATARSTALCGHYWKQARFVPMWVHQVGCILFASQQGASQFCEAVMSMTYVTNF